MRSVYKAVSALIILLMLFNASVFAAQELNVNSDGSANISNKIYEAAAKRLVALGVLSDHDINGEPKNYITKAEFVVILLKTINMQDFDNGYSDFEDVGKEYWASKQIKIACDIGIVKKGDNEKFEPDRGITYEEAIKMCVILLNYEQIAEGQGGYPYGYISIALKEKIIKNISIKYSSAMLKEDAVILINNILEVPMAVKSKYNDSYVKSGTNGSTEVTLLKSYLKFNKVKVKIISSDYKKLTLDVYEGKSYSEYQKYYVAETVDIRAAAGYATIYVHEDDELVYYISQDDDSAVIYDYIDGVNNDYSVDSEYYAEQIETIHLKNTNQEYYLDDAVIYFNDKPIQGKAKVYINCFAKVTIVDDRITRMDIYKLSEGGLIYRADPDQLKFSRGEVYENTWNGFATVNDLQIIIDGNLCSNMRDLGSDMVFDYWKSDDDRKFIIVASSRRVKNYLTEVSHEELKVGDEVYKINKEYGIFSFSTYYNSYRKDESLTYLLNQQVTIYIDDNQTVRYIKVDTELTDNKVFSGVVMSAHMGTFGDDKQMKIFCLTGTIGEKVFSVSKNMKNSPVSFEAAAKFAGDLNGRGVFEFTLNSNGIISKIDYLKHFDDVNTISTSFKEDYPSINYKYVGMATIFAILDIDGVFTVKILDYNTNLRLRKTYDGSPITVTTDFDIKENPVPRFMMLTTNCEKLFYEGTTTQIVTGLTELVDDKYRLTLANGTKYTVSGDLVRREKLTPNMILTYYFSGIGKDPIRVVQMIDISKESSQWQTDVFNSGTSIKGFFKADTVLLRTDDIIQFEINGEPSDVMRLRDENGNPPEVYRLIRKRNKNLFLPAPTGRSSSSVPNYLLAFKGYGVMNINRGDKVWFGLNAYPAPRRVNYIIYESENDIW